MTYPEQPRWAADLHWEQRPDSISHRDVAGVAVDSAGSVYVGEVTYTYGIKLGRVPADHAPHQIQKFTAPQGPVHAEG